MWPPSPGFCHLLHWCWIVVEWPRNRKCRWKCWFITRSLYAKWAAFRKFRNAARTSLQSYSLVPNCERQRSCNTLSLRRPTIRWFNLDMLARRSRTRSCGVAILLHRKYVRKKQIVDVMVPPQLLQSRGLSVPSKSAHFDLQFTAFTALRNPTALVQWTRGRRVRLNCESGCSIKSPRHPEGALPL